MTIPHPNPTPQEQVEELQRRAFGSKTGTVAGTIGWFKDTATGAAKQIAGTPGDVATGIGNAASDAGSAAANAIPGVSQLQSLAETISSPGFWKRILVGAAGVYLIYLGVILIIASSPLGKKIEGVATTVASRGLVSKGT